MECANRKIQKTLNHRVTATRSNTAYFKHKYREQRESQAIVRMWKYLIIYETIL